MMKAIVLIEEAKAELAASRRAVAWSVGSWLAADSASARESPGVETSEAVSVTSCR